MVHCSPCVVCVPDFFLCFPRSDENDQGLEVSAAAEPFIRPKTSPTLSLSKSTSNPKKNEGK